MQVPETVNKYFNKKFSAKWNLEWNQKEGIENVVVIPAISEYENIKTLLASLSKNDQHILDNTLILFVINNLHSSSEEVKNNNKKSIDFLRELIHNRSLLALNNFLLDKQIQLGLVDASSKGNELNDKTGGVGLARKIGMDLSLKVFDYSSQKMKIIISLDADCTVEENYMSAITDAFNDLNLSAATIEFLHRTDSESNTETIIGYEIFLRYYVIGLFFAKSHFAYHTIGSAFACDSEAYIKVGGMNTRQAAEDFYFLQKLAKISKINKINRTVVYPSARQSWRVPFGTGNSVTQFQNGKKQFLLYDPKVFVILKQWIKLFNSDEALNTEVLLRRSKDIHIELYNYFIQKDFSAKWEKILGNCNSERQLNYQRINWFDAFNTLKLIHHLRDTAFPMKEAESALENMFNLLRYDFDIDCNDQKEKSDFRKYLNALIKIENSFTNILTYSNISTVVK
jgi:hypothetical protein